MGEFVFFNQYTFWIEAFLTDYIYDLPLVQVDNKKAAGVHILGNGSLRVIFSQTWESFIVPQKNQ